MRWMWIDTFVEFEPRQRATSVKSVTLAEDYLQDHLPGYPIFPASLMIEGMAQTAGILVGEARGFAENVILAKIRKAAFDDFAVPGDQLRYEATMESIGDAGATTTGLVFKNGQQIGSVDLIFSHVSAANARVGLPQENFVFTDSLRSLAGTIYERARKGDKSS